MNLTLPGDIIALSISSYFDNPGTSSRPGSTSRAHCTTDSSVIGKPMITILLNDLKSSKQVFALMGQSRWPAQDGLKATRRASGNTDWNSMMLIGEAQAQTPGLPPDISFWDIFLADPSFVVMSLVPVTILVIFILVVRRRYARFFGIQREALDHRKAADAQALSQSQSTQQLIAQQYGVVNAYYQQIAARSDEGLRISNETLAQINTMNQTLSRIADRLDRVVGPAA